MPDCRPGINTGMLQHSLNIFKSQCSLAGALAVSHTDGRVSDPLTTAEQVTGLDTKLNDPTAMMTVFVPINSAFDALAQQLNSSVPALLAQTDMLTQARLLVSMFWRFIANRQMYAEHLKVKV